MQLAETCTEATPVKVTDKVSLDLTWVRLEEVLRGHVRGGTAMRQTISHLLMRARESAAAWTEAELCIELMSIVAIALHQPPMVLRLCGTLASDSYTEATMT